MKYTEVNIPPTTSLAGTILAFAAMTAFDVVELLAQQPQLEFQGCTDEDATFYDAETETTIVVNRVTETVTATGSPNTDSLVRAKAARGGYDWPVEFIEEATPVGATVN